MQMPDASLFSPYQTALQSPAQLSNYAYSLCGGPCAGLFSVENSLMLEDLVQKCRTADIPYRVLGGMSNILVSDSGFDGIVLLNRKGKLTYTESPDGSILLQADSGTPMAAVVRYCAEHGFSGFEWAAGLPGTVGGAVYGNAGAFGSETAEIFSEGTVIEPDGRTSSCTGSDLAFAYRSSVLKRGNGNRILLNASFRLIPGDSQKIRKTGEEYRQTRREKQPLGAPSLGSVFKNPPGESAGKLIQAAGLKGMSIGKATVSTVHANFITTEKGVRSRDYFDLILTVQKSVREMFGIILEPEVEFLGFEAI